MACVRARTLGNVKPSPTMSRQPEVPNSIAMGADVAQATCARLMPEDAPHPLEEQEREHAREDQNAHEDRGSADADALDDLLVFGPGAGALDVELEVVLRARPRDWSGRRARGLRLRQIEELRPLLMRERLRRLVVVTDRHPGSLWRSEERRVGQDGRAR